MIMCQRNLPQLRQIFEEYEKITGHPIEKAIENEFSGTSKDSLISLIQCIRNRTEYFVKRLHDSMAGIGTDDKTLIRIIVSRSEIDLGEIKEAYEAIYEKTLADRVKVGKYGFHFIKIGQIVNNCFYFRMILLVIIKNV